MSEVKQAFSEAYDRYKQYARSRSESDLAEFHTAYRQAVLKFARKHIPHSSSPGTYVATDLVNDSFLKLAEEALDGKEFESEVDIQKHALTIIRNRFLDIARAKNVRSKTIDPQSLEVIQAMDPGWEVPYRNAEYQVQIAAAIEDLGRFDTKAAFIAQLFIYGGQDQEEIASDLDVSIKTVRRALLKFVARLQADQA